ncbi:MAG: RNA polymerase sigma factor [Lewinella sp.]|nr:RNA polymerase sigma factor [Lewinella sp.]
MADEQLLALLLDPHQREHGFRLLLAQYQERLYRHLARMLGSAADADDVLQNSLVKVFRNIDRFRGQSRLYTWMYRIATNEALTFLEQQKRQPTGLAIIDEDGLTALDRVPADSQVDGEWAQALLQRAVDQLPPRQRTVFCLRYYEEMNYQDMSDILSTTQGSLKASYHHAVRKVEDFLRQHCE